VESIIDDDYDGKDDDEEAADEYDCDDMTTFILRLLLFLLAMLSSGRPNSHSLHFRLNIHNRRSG